MATPMKKCNPDFGYQTTFGATVGTAAACLYASAATRSDTNTAESVDVNDKWDSRRNNDNGRTMPHASTAIAAWRLKDGKPAMEQRETTKTMFFHDRDWHDLAKPPTIPKRPTYPDSINAAVREPMVLRTSSPWYTRNHENPSTDLMAASYVDTPSAVATRTTNTAVKQFKSVVKRSIEAPTSQPLRGTQAKTAKLSQRGVKAGNTAPTSTQARQAFQVWMNQPCC
jgi:hypothetical protein